MGRVHEVSNWFSRLAGAGHGMGGLLLLALLFNPARAFSATSPATHSVTLMWDHNLGADETTGYRVYFSTTSQSYSDSVAVGNVTTGTVSGLTGGVTYYFAVTANDASGLESGFSEEVSYMPRVPRMQTRVMPGGPMMLIIEGLIGHTYYIEASEDLTNWNVIGTVLLESEEALNFTDPDAASFAKRFYRLRDVSL